jgi:predicted RNase H-like HicB family nuclease
MRLELTAIYEPQDDGWIVASIAEIPEVLTQGRTMDDARKNLADALRQSFCVQREMTLPSIAEKHVSESLVVDVNGLP